MSCSTIAHVVVIIVIGSVVTVVFLVGLDLDIVLFDVNDGLTEKSVRFLDESWRDLVGVKREDSATRHADSQCRKCTHDVCAVCTSDSL